MKYDVKIRKTYYEDASIDIDAQSADDAFRIANKMVKNNEVEFSAMNKTQDNVLEFVCTDHNGSAQTYRSGGISVEEEVGAMSDDVLLAAYNKVIVMEAEKDVREHIISLQKAGEIPKNMEISDYDVMCIVHNVLYEEQCYPSQYERIDNDILEHYGRDSLELD